MYRYGYGLGYGRRRRPSGGLIIGPGPGPGPDPEPEEPEAVPHRYWRLYMITNNGSASFVTAGEIEFRGEPGGEDLTGNGAAIASSYSSDATRPELAFDDIAETAESGGSYWSCASGSHVGAWIGYDFGEGNEVDINEVWFYPARAVDRQPRDMLVQWSDDGEVWRPKWAIRDQTGWTLGQARTFTFPGAAKVSLVDVAALAGSLATSRSFDNVAFGKADASRILIAVVTSVVTDVQNRNITAVSIGGVSATQIAEPSASATTNRVEIWAAAVPEGESGTVTVNVNVVSNRWGLAIYRAVDVDLSSLQLASEGSLAVPENGFAIVGACRQHSQGQPPELSGIPLDVARYSAGSHHAFASGSLISEEGETLSLSATDSNIVGASWAFNS